MPPEVSLESTFRGEEGEQFSDADYLTTFASYFLHGHAKPSGSPLQISRLAQVSPMLMR